MKGGGIAERDGGKKGFMSPQSSRNPWEWIFSW